jgi:cobalt-zinc-cadmium efflux system outer membrane protein
VESPTPPLPEAIPPGQLVEAAPRLTLEELESIALERNPTLVQAEMRIQAATGKQVQVGLYPNPVLGYQSDDIGLEGTAGKQGGFIGQEIVTQGKLRLRRAVAGQEVAQARYGLEAQQLRVLNDVRAGWYNVLVAQQMMELNGRLVRIGQQGVEAAEQLLAAKEVSRVDLLQAKIEADSARVSLYDATARHLAAWRQLATVVGAPDMEPATLDGDFRHIPELSWDLALEQLLSQSPELAQARAGVARAQCELAEQCAERIPNLDLLANVQKDNIDGRATAGAGLAWAVPIINRNQGNILKAKADLIAARKEVARLDLALRDRLAVAFARYDGARHQAERYAADILPSAKMSLDLVEQGYRQGEFDYLKLLTAQRTYFQVNLAYLESLLEAQTKAVQIEGLLLSGGLGEMLQDEGLRIYGVR